MATISKKTEDPLNVRARALSSPAVVHGASFLLPPSGVNRTGRNQSPQADAPYHPSDRRGCQVISCLSGCFSKPQYVGVGLGLAAWKGPPASHLLIGRGLVLDPEREQGSERRHRLLAPTMAKHEFIKTSLVQLAAHGTRARFPETLGAACPYTTNWGLLKQPDKHESSNQPAVS